MNVLFVCVANSGRSVMAECLFREAAGDRHRARSAGSEPGTAAHPQVIQALSEIGIDASDHEPQKLNSDMLEWADLAVSTCSEEVCPITPSVSRITWELPPIPRICRSNRSGRSATRSSAASARWSSNSTRPPKPA